MMVKLIKLIFPVGILLVMLANSGCLYIPPLGKQFTEEKQARIVVGSTKKPEVIELLGNPDLLESQRYFVYETKQDKGWIIFAAAGTGGAGVGGGMAGFPLYYKRYVVLLEFDKADIVKRYDIETINPSPAGIKSSKEPSHFKQFTEHSVVIHIKRKSFLGIPEYLAFNSVSFSPDGERLAASVRKGAGDSGEIWIKNLKTDRLQAIDTEDFEKLIISPDFSRAALLKRRVTILDLNTHKVLTVFRGNGDSFFWTLAGASCLAFDPQSDLVATGGYDGRVVVWSSRTGEEIRSIQGHKGAVLSVAYSPDGRWLATLGKDEQVRLWDVATGDKIESLKARGGTLQFSPRGDLLAINSGRHVELWHVNVIPNKNLDAPKLELVDVFLLPLLSDNYRVTIQPLSFSQDGRLLGVSNGAMVIYDILKVQEILRIDPCKPEGIDTFFSIALCPDGLCFATGTDRSVVNLWQLRPAEVVP